MNCPVCGQECTEEDGWIDPVRGHAAPEEYRCPECQGPVSEAEFQRQAQQEQADSAKWAATEKEAFDPPEGEEMSALIALLRMTLPDEGNAGPFPTGSAQLIADVEELESELAALRAQCEWYREHMNHAGCPPVTCQYDATGIYCGECWAAHLATEPWKQEAQGG